MPSPDGHEAGPRQGRRELDALAAARSRFVRPALASFVVFYGAFLACVAYAHGFMATKAIGAVTWAYLWALALIAYTWLVALLYMRYSERTLAPLTERALRAGPAGDAGEGGRP